MPDKPFGTRTIKAVKFGQKPERRRSPRKSGKRKKAAENVRTTNDEKMRNLAKARAQRTENLKAAKAGREPKKVRGPRK